VATSQGMTEMVRPPVSAKIRTLIAPISNRDGKKLVHCH
jgi:hypothetical protein